MCDMCSTCKWRRDAKTEGYSFCWIRNVLVSPKEECKWWKAIGDESNRYFSQPCGFISQIETTETEPEDHPGYSASTPIVRNIRVGGSSCVSILRRTKRRLPTPNRWR